MTIHPTAVVDASAQIAEGVVIGPWCIVGLGGLGHMGVKLAAAMGAHSAYTRLLLPHLAPTSMMTGNVTQIVLDAMELMLGKGDTATKIRMSKSLWTLAAFATGAIVAGFCYVAVSFWALLLPIGILVWLLRKEHYCNLEAEQS